METLTLEQIAYFLPYGLSVFSEIHKRVDLLIGLDLTHTGKERAILKRGDNATYYDSLSLIKPILRPMDLEKPITIDGKELIPFIELGKIISTEQGYLYNDIFGNVLGVKFDNGLILQKYKDTNIFSVSQAGTIYGFDMIPIIAWLSKYKYDFLDLVEKGLAIDVNTLDKNPY